jgi:ABC-type multidrug transport system ATPase subunit
MPESFPRAAAPLLQVTGLTRRFGRVRALDGVSFGIRAGEVLGVIGPNGAGKTTLLECVAGLQPAEAGAVARDGAALDLAARRALLFYVPDAIVPWPSQTVGWAIDFVAGYLSGRSERAGIVSALALEPLLGTRIGALSKGERKRALLAMGLVTTRPVLLVDEPFDGLDLRQTRQAADLLQAEAARGRALVLSIHQIAAAARLCDRFVLLAAGRVRGEGTNDELAGRHATGERDADRASALEEAFLALG